MSTEIIKPHLVRPIIEKLELEKLQPPKSGSVINIRPVDNVEIRKVTEDIVRVTMTRSLLIEPECLAKLCVVMSIDIPVDSIEFSRLDDPKGYIKDSQPMKILISYVASVIASVTTYSNLGPIITPPGLQE